MASAGAGWARRLHWTSRRIAPGIVVRHGVLHGPAEQVHEAIVSPGAFRGRVEVIHDGAVAGQHTASAVAAVQHAALVVNGGFFIVTGSAGYPGAPAGLAVYHGRRVDVGGRARRAGAGRRPAADRAPDLDRHGDGRRIVACGAGHQPAARGDRELRPARLPAVPGPPAGRHLLQPQRAGAVHAPARGARAQRARRAGRRRPARHHPLDRFPARRGGPGSRPGHPGHRRRRHLAAPGTRGPAVTWPCGSGSPTAAASRCRCGPA